MVAVTNTWLQLASLQLNIHTNNNNTVSTQHRLECSTCSRGPRLPGGLAGGHCVGPHSMPASGGSRASPPTSGLAGASRASTSSPCWVGPPGALTSFSSWAGRTLPRPPALAEQLPRTPRPPAQLPSSGEQEQVQASAGAPVAPTRRVGTGVEVGCALAGLTLWTGMGAVPASATPTQSKDACGGCGRSKLPNSQSPGSSP